MVWEDDPVRRPLLAAILEQAGFAVARPLEVDAALELAAQVPVLLLDANVTRPSGSEFLRELRHRRRAGGPRTLALVQPGQAGLRAAMVDLGVDRVLFEPLSPPDLVAAVRELLHSRGRAA